jgi:hypothetical protein
VGKGNQDALNELTALVYKELRQLAASYLRKERQGHTLQPTALVVHEAYLHLRPGSALGRGPISSAKQLMARYLHTFLFRRPHCGEPVEIARRSDEAIRE